MSGSVTGEIPPPNQQLYNSLVPRTGDSDGKKSTEIALTGTLDSTYVSAAWQSVNASYEQARLVTI